MGIVAADAGLIRAIVVVLLTLILGADAVTRIELSGCNTGGLSAPPFAAVGVTCPCFLQYQFYSSADSIWDIYFMRRIEYTRWQNNNFSGLFNYDPDISVVSQNVIADTGMQQKPKNVLLEGDYILVFHAKAGGRVCFTVPPGVTNNPSRGELANFLVLQSMPEECPVVVADPPPPTSQQRIVGGTEAAVSGSTLTFFRWIAVIWRSGQSICGGSHIAPGFVLTAAHCEIQTAIDEYSVRIGAPNDDSGPAYAIEKVWVHPEYELLSAGDTINDVAIFQIKDRNVDLDDYIVPLAQDSNLPNPGEYVTTAGYGDLFENWSTDMDPNRLRKVDLKTWSTSDCRRIFNSVKEESHICAGEDQGNCDSCQADSGGPLRYIKETNGTRQEELVGVVSFGSGCARKGLPGVYARVSYHVPWIQQVIGGDRNIQGQPTPTTELNSTIENLFGGTLGIALIAGLSALVLLLAVFLGIFFGT